MKKVLLIADDLTGVLDSAVALAEKGLDTRLALKAGTQAEALAISTDSRHELPGEAYRRVFAAIRQNRGYELIFKKTDSLLRGNVGAELSATMDAAEENELWFVPAYPENGRTTEGGVQYVNGCELKKAVNDPFEPLVSSNIAEILKKQTAKKVVSVSSDFERGSIAVSEPTIFVVDASTQQELEKIAKKLFVGNAPRCVAGCGAMARALPLSGGLDDTDELVESEGLIVVSGSLSAVTRAQIAAAQSAGDSVTVLTQAQKAGGGPVSLPEPKESQALVIAAADEHSLMSGDADLIAELLAGLAVRALDIMPRAALCVFGGDTLSAVLKRLKVRSVLPIKELACGVVVSHAETGSGALRLVSKSGGFGEKDVIAEIKKYGKILPRK